MIKSHELYVMKCNVTNYGSRIVMLRIVIPQVMGLAKQLAESASRRKRASDIQKKIRV